MIRKYLDDIVLLAYSKNIENYTDEFVKQWQTQLEEFGFVIDSEGRMISAAKPISGVALRVMNEYIMLRCLFTHTANGFSPDNRNYCRNSWEQKNISIQSQQDCNLTLNIISAKLQCSIKHPQNADPNPI
jgi:hypothetical protein